MSLFTSLKYLVALHQHKHFGRAAQACHVTQPALSNAIRALEKEFDCSIVKRGRSFDCFTPEGEKIFLTAQRMLREQEMLQQALKSSAGMPVGTLSLGAVPSVMPIAARFAGQLQKRHPGIHISLRSMSSQDIEAGLENLSLDLALGYTGRISASNTALVSVWQYNEHYFLLRRATSPSASGLRILEKACNWSAAADYPLCLLTPEMHNRTVVDAAFRQAGSTPRPVIETNSILTLGLTVLVGEVCSVLPGALVAVLAGYNTLEAVPLSAPEIVTPIGFMHARTGQPSHTLRAALELAGEAGWLADLRQHTGLLQSSGD